MNRNHLALFHAVASTGSISRGAARARVSQPAVSKQIGDLEDDLGLRLLDRLPRGCALTEAGRVLADYAGRWLALEREAEQAMAELRGLKRGRLTVGASLTIGGYLLPAVLADYHRRYPEIELKVEVANTETIQKALLDGAIEVGLTEGPLRSGQLRSEVFWEDELVVIAPAGHRLLGRRDVTPREIVREPFLLREEGSGTRAVVEQAFRRKGLKLAPVMSLASPVAIKNLVVSGVGIAMISRLIVEQELRAGTLGIVAVKGLTVRRPLHRQSLAERSPSPALAKFLAVLRGLGPLPR